MRKRSATTTRGRGFRHEARLNIPEAMPLEGVPLAQWHIVNYRKLCHNFQDNIVMHQST